MINFPSIPGVIELATWFGELGGIESLEELLDDIMDLLLLLLDKLSLW